MRALTKVTLNFKCNIASMNLSRWVICTLLVGILSGLVKHHQVENMLLARLMGLKAMDKMEIGLSLSQEIVTTFLEACMWYLNCPLDILFGSIVKELNHPFQSILQVHVASTPTLKRS